jgi:ATP-dependent Clp protease ATP-binding subunit ClpB
MTSNVGSLWIQQYGADDYAKMRSMVMEALKESFKPEFLNRIDETIIYHPLEVAQIREIAAIQLRVLAKRVAEKNLTLDVTDRAAEYIATQGYDPAYGARPLKRTIQRLIQDPLALLLLAGKFADGDSVHVDLAEDGQGLLIT